MVTKIKESRIKEISRKTPRKIGIFLVYLLSGLIIIAGVFSLFDSILVGVIDIFAGLIICPLTWKFLKKKGINIKWWILLIIFFILISISGGLGD